MYRIPINSWLHQMHLPNRHNTAIRMKHLFTDDRFWAFIGLSVLILMMVIMAFLASTSDAPTTIIPYSPMGPFVP